MKPKPFVALNHLTVPVAILLLQDAQMRAVPARPSRGLDPISAMSWGGEPVWRDQQGKSIIRMGGVYATPGEIASDDARGWAKEPTTRSPPALRVTVLAFRGTSTRPGGEPDQPS